MRTTGETTNMMDNNSTSPQQPILEHRLEPLPIDPEKMESLMQAGVFDIISGRVEISIHNGQIQDIYIYERRYKRKKKK